MFMNYERGKRAKEATTYTLRLAMVLRKIIVFVGTVEMTSWSIDSCHDGSDNFDQLFVVFDNLIGKKNCE